MSPQPKPVPDIKQVTPDEWPRRPLPRVFGQRHPGFQVVARRSVLNDIYRHGHANPHQEICGILVGNVYQDDAGAFLYVEASIRGEHAGSQDTQVTFTAQTWTYLQEEMEKHHAGQRILGWYHTHPGFGIFLSDMDRFIHENFFGLPWQVAYVYDPLSGEEGMFLWRKGEPVCEGFLVEEDAVTEKRQTVARHAGEPTIQAAVLSERLMVLEKQQKWLLGGLAALAFLVLVWPMLVGGLGRSAPDDSSRDWVQHFISELGQLRSQTGELRNEAQQLHHDMGQLRAAHQVLLGHTLLLRQEITDLDVECQRRLPPLARMPLATALQLDLVPGPPRPLLANIMQALFPDRRRARQFIEDVRP